MTRTLYTLGLVAVLVAPSRAQQAGAKPELLIRLSVAAAAAPEPALKYSLVPELAEMNPGNPIQGYLKCILQQYRFAFDEGAFERRETLLAMPLDDLREPEMRELGRNALAKIDAAARLDNPDWQILLKLRADGLTTLLPDVQAMRSLGRALAVRFRAEVAEGRVDDAICTAKTMFAMGRHVGEHPSLIGCLVGWAIANSAFGPLEEMLEHPSCPNLYWALANLPDPLISIRTGMAGERMILWAVFRELDTVAPMTAEQIKKFIDPLEQLFGEGKPVGIRGYLAARTKDEKKMATARKRLVDSGLPEVRINAFSPEQVILLDEARECQARFDEIAKISVFSAWRFEALAEKVKAAKREPAIFADVIWQAQFAGRRTQGRLEQRIALLRHVEALRMYAAEHSGAFPAKLSDVSVPLPEDPFTGKPFLYEASGKTAHLRGSPPAAMENDKFFRVHYEITLKD